ALACAPSPVVVVAVWMLDKLATFGCAPLSVVGADVEIGAGSVAIAAAPTAPLGFTPGAVGPFGAALVAGYAPASDDSLAPAAAPIGSTPGLSVAVAAAVDTGGDTVVGTAAGGVAVFFMNAANCS